MEISQNFPTQIPQVYPAQSFKKPAVSYIIIILSIALVVVSALLIYTSYYSYIIPLIWKSAPDSGNRLLTRIDVPIEPDGKIIQGVGVMYRFNTEVKGVTINNGIEKIIQVTDESKAPPFTVNSNTEFYLGSSKNQTTIDRLKPGQKVTLLSVYRPITRTWELWRVTIKND